jgi:hypothetical protein
MPTANQAIISIAPSEPSPMCKPEIVPKDEEVVSHLPLSSFTRQSESVKDGFNSINRGIFHVLDCKKHDRLLASGTTHKGCDPLRKAMKPKSQNLYNSHEEHVKELLFVFLSR